MTLSVPYSFVPGTKAKADEVNANFIAVLDKIEETNTSKVNIDLSNLDNTGQSILNAKADKSEIDGEWIPINEQLAYNVSLQGNSYLTYDLSPYLPDDNNIYEILLSGRAATTYVTGAYAPLLVRTNSIGTTIYLCSCRAINTTSVNCAGAATIPIGNDRELYITRTPDYQGLFTLLLCGYRKVR